MESVSGGTVALRTKKHGFSANGERRGTVRKATTECFLLSGSKKSIEYQIRTK